MKKSIFISVFCLFLFGINSVAEELEIPEDFKKTRLVWGQLFDDINERLSRLESEFREEKRQRQEFNSIINDNLDNLTKIMNERIDKVEKTGSILETNNIAKSFKDTIGILNKNSSEMEKRLETLAVNVAVVEKIYHVSQKPLVTLMKVIDEQKAVIIKMNKMLKKHEKIILAMRKNSKKQIASNGAKAKTVKESDDRITEKESGNIAGSTGVRVAFSEIESKKTSKSDTEKPDSQNLTEIGKGIFIKNVTLKQFGSSTKISGEVINRSNIDYSTANFKIQFYEKDGELLKSHELSILNFKIGNTKNFDELIPGIEPKTIAGYDILFEDSKLTTSTGKEKIKMYDKKSETALTEAKAEQPQSVKEKSVEVAAATTPDKSKDFKAIGNDFYVRGVTFSEYGSSSIMKGELKNDTRRDMASVSFSMKFLGKDGGMIAEIELSIISFKSNEIKPFEQLISGVHPSQISEYEIVCKRKL